jgi:Glycoside hydrolase family 95, C-terminal domain
MKIAIAERLHPFSHENGIQFLLPKTSYSVRVFPTQIELVDLDAELPGFSYFFDLAGPIKDFTAELDLERGFLRVFGMTKKGFMRYILSAKKGGIELIWQKVPEGFKAENLHLSLPLEEKELKNQERLSLGMHKSQDWTLVRRRLDMKEIFPVLFAMGRWAVSKASAAKAGNYQLLDKCREQIQTGKKHSVLEAFENLFLASFEGVLVPRLYDTEYQGILPREGEVASFSPVPLLIEASALVRSLFIQKNHDKISILPCLPSQFHSGRIVKARIDDLIMDLEWSKKSLRRLQISATKERKIAIVLPKSLCSCRIRRGKSIATQSISGGRLSLSLQARCTLDFDRFSSI